MEVAYRGVVGIRRARLRPCCGKKEATEGDGPRGAHPSLDTAQTEKFSSFFCPTPTAPLCM